MNWKKSSKRLSLWGFVIVSLAAFVYVIARAYIVDITHDEAYSFFLVETNYFRAMATTANTHWTNSLCMKLISMSFGKDIFLLRMHSILSFAMMSYFVYKAAKNFLKADSIIILALVFCANHFALEYFIYARGYAMSIAALVGAIYYALRYVQFQRFDIRFFNASLVMGIIAVASNYTALFQFIGIIGFQLISLWYTKKNIQESYKQIGFTRLFFFVATVFIAIINLLAIKFISNDLQYGGDHSFFTETLDGMLNLTLFSYNEHSTTSHFTWSSALFFAIMLSMLIVGIIRKSNALLLTSLLFLFQVFCNYFLYFAFATPFPLLRTSSLMFPAIGFGLVFLWDEIKFKQGIKMGLAIILLIVGSIHLIQTNQIQNSYEWPQQIHTEEAYDTIAKTEGDNKVKILSYKHYYGVWQNYYRLLKPYGAYFEVEITKPDFPHVIPQGYQSYNYILSPQPMTDIEGFDLFKQYKQEKSKTLYVYQRKE